MKKFRGALISPLTAITFILCLFLAYGVAGGQEESPDLELDEYRIIGKDTRVFVITGDRISTVDFFAEPLLLQEEERGIETSQGLIENRNRLFMVESFELTKGPYARADIFAGSRTADNLWGKVSLDMGKSAGTVNATSRHAEENTRTNSAPSRVAPMLVALTATRVQLAPQSSEYAISIGVAPSVSRATRIR